MEAERKRRRKIFILQTEIREILQEGVAREEDNGSDEGVDDDAFSFLRLFFVASGSDVIVRAEDEEEYRCRTREEEREVGKLGEYALSPWNVAGVSHLDPSFDDAQKYESENAVKNASFGLLDGFVIASGGNELESGHDEKEYRGSHDRYADEHEHSAFDRSVPIGEINEDIASRRLNRKVRRIGISGRYIDGGLRSEKRKHLPGNVDEEEGHERVHDLPLVFHERLFRAVRHHHHDAGIYEIENRHRRNDDLHASNYRKSGIVRFFFYRTAARGSGRNRSHVPCERSQIVNGRVCRNEGNGGQSSGNCRDDAFRNRHVSRR